MWTNRERAHHAYRALAGTVSSNPYVDREDHATSVSDFLADLMHFCDRFGVDFEAALMRAETHYLAELDEEAERKAADSFSEQIGRAHV